MKIYRAFALLLLAGLAACSRSEHPDTNSADFCACDTCEVKTSTDRFYPTVSGALLGTRFKSLDELKTVLRIEYVNSNAETDSTIYRNSRVYISACSNGADVTAVLESGISQGDIDDAKDGTFWDRVDVLFRSPYAVRSRRDLEGVFLLARLRPALFGEGDVAFFNLAQNMVRNINTMDMAIIESGDTSEKGYLNTFNHITAQAFITSCFSEELADFVGDAHERYNHPVLIIGKFTEKKLNDLGEGPVDNYVDIINNEWGQEVGKQLSEKYGISRKTFWTPELLANYLNDLQDYFGWTLQIGFRPFTPGDEQVIKFAAKLNSVLNSRPTRYYRSL